MTPNRGPPAVSTTISSMSILARPRLRLRLEGEAGLLPKLAGGDDRELGEELKARMVQVKSGQVRSSQSFPTAELKFHTSADDLRGYRRTAEGVRSAEPLETGARETG